MYNAFGNIITSFRNLRGNAKYVVLFYPLFSVPFAMSNIFFGLYLKALGVSSAQMGYLLSITFVSTIVLSFFSNTIIDKIGRKRFSLIADGIILPLVFLTRLVADSYWLFVVAAVIGGCMALSGMTTNFMLSEDTPPEKRIYSFNAFNIIMIGSGLATLLAGPLLDRLGVVLAEKYMLGATVIGMVVMAIVRNHFYKETGIGMQAMAGTRQSSKKFGLGIDLRTLKGVAADRQLALALFITVFFMVFTYIGSFNMSMYYTLYVTDVLKFTAGQAAIFAAIGAVFQLITAFFIIPSLPMHRPRRNIVIGLTASCLSMVLLILTPVHNLFWLIGANALYAVGFGITRPCSDTLLANAALGPKRAAIYSLMSLASNSLNAVGFMLAGQIYNFRPAWLYLFAMSFALVILIVLFIGYVIRMIQRRSSLPVLDPDSACDNPDDNLTPKAGPGESPLV